MFIIICPNAYSMVAGATACLCRCNHIHPYRSLSIFRLLYSCLVFSVSHVLEGTDFVKVHIITLFFIVCFPDSLLFSVSSSHIIMGFSANVWYQNLKLLVAMVTVLATCPQEGALHLFKVTLELWKMGSISKRNKSGLFCHGYLKVFTSTMMTFAVLSAVE